MAKPRRISEPPAGQDSVGVDDYVVRTADGEAAGTVEHLARSDDRLLLVVERAAAPGRHDRRLVEWSDVESIDHEALAVWLRLTTEQLDAAPTPQPETANGEGLSAAERLVDVPPELVPRPESSPGGPVDRALLPLLIGVVGAMALTALVVVAAATAFQTPWLYLGLIVPAILFVATVGILFRISRRPYEPHGAKKL